MTFEIDKEKLMRFIKSGIIVLSAILLIAAGVHFVPKAVQTISNSKRELPIYCVGTDKKQVALSFDAAWGNDIIRHMTNQWVQKHAHNNKLKNVKK